MQSEVRYGPQPYEAVLSTICEAFGCTPDVAEQQSWATVSAILDYRTARMAVDAFNDKEGGMAAMNRSPQLLTMLRAMQQAQTGTDESGEANAE